LPVPQLARHLPVIPVTYPADPRASRSVRASRRPAGEREVTMNGRLDPDPIMPVGNGGTYTSSSGQAQNRKAELKQKAQSMADSRKDQLVERIDHVSAAFRRTGEQLKNEEQQELSRYVEMIGDRVSRVASYLRTHGTEDLTHDVERFARRQPAIFIGGAFAIGFLAARFLKSSAERAESEYTPEPQDMGLASGL
jgi:hypothetical protein